MPEWFGIPESTAAYIRESAGMPFWAVWEGDEPAGFIVLKETSPCAAEIYVMGVMPQYHRQGVGRQLLAALEACAQQHGYRFLQVKTVREGCYAEYNRTNAFYRSMGFGELECLPQLWDENNPCQIYVKALPRPNYQGTRSCAAAWARHGVLADWVHAYLCSDGHNQPFSDGLKMARRIYLGPVTLPLSLFQRCCGPEDTMTYRVEPTGWERKVQSLQAAIQSGCDLPPLIVHYLIPEGQTEGEFELNDGNHRWEALARLGAAEAPVIVWITDRCEYEQFQQRYAQYLRR